MRKVIDHFDGSSFAYEDDRTTTTNGQAVDVNNRPVPRFPNDHGRGVPSPDQQETVRARVSGIAADEENKALVADVLCALSNLTNPGDSAPPSEKQTRLGTRVKVHTVGPGFAWRAPPLASSEFFAVLVVVAILLLFAPAFTVLAAGVFVTSRFSRGC